MKTNKYILLFLLITCMFSLHAGKPLRDEFCGIRNISTQNGEQITLQVYYSVAGIYVNAGTATFSNTVERLNGRTVFHVVGEGKTNSNYDWIFKVRDRYETYIDTLTMQPLKFIRNVNEGGYKKYENVSFNHAANTAITTKGTFKVPDCVQDVISAVYYARNIDFSKYKPDDRIPFTMFLDNEVYNMYIRYLGKEDVKTKYGTFKAIKFKPLLVKGEVFKGGENMTVWVSDDPNKIILRVESPILVGSIKVDMMGYKNLRYPLSSLKKLKGR